MILSSKSSTEVLSAIKAAFKAYSGVRKLGDFSFRYEQGEWHVIHRATADLWYVVETANGLEFRLVGECLSGTVR